MLNFKYTESARNVGLELNSDTNDNTYIKGHFKWYKKTKGSTKYVMTE